VGPIIGVPIDVAQAIKDTTDLVEVDGVLPDVVDEPDVQLGGTPFGDILLLTETPADGYGLLVSIFAEYANNGPKPFELIVIDENDIPHPFPIHIDVDRGSIRNHLKLAYYGESGDRRPLILHETPSSP
jgi:hypothetical protein